ncbi:MAG: DUF2147 domain-containing protein [Bacteroidales bacterium]|nr:DUF2147 domain-containing protein [Bacteroidales bacterium]
MHKTILTLCGLLLATLATGQAKKADAILGTWLNEDKDAHVGIYKENGKYFGDVNTLKIRGYIGISWIGRNTYWTRVP